MYTSWITLPNDHPNYINGCEKFIELAKKNLVDGKTTCPCKSCKLRYYLTPGEIEGHILFKGFYHKYTDWCWHGKRDVLDHLHGECREEHIVGRDDMKGLLDTVYGTNIPNHSKYLDDNYNTFDGSVEIENEAEFDDVSMGFSSSGESDHAYDARTDDFPNNPHNFNNKEGTNYKKLLEAASEELYEGCESFSKLSFLLHLYHMKCMFHWSIESFNKLLELLLQAFPQVREFPSTFYEGKRIINDLGLGYEKIHACPYNHMLFWGVNKDKEECDKCHTSRWKIVKGGKGKDLAKKGEGAKVMRYFPFIPRLLRVYASSKTAEDMRWHHKDRVRDGKLRHPADGLAWEQFDSRYPLFASDPRSVRYPLFASFCPIRQTNWHRVPQQFKVDIINCVREHFVIPDGDGYDKGILKRVGNCLRQYRHELKDSLITPTTKNREEVYKKKPADVPLDSWIELVDYWYSDKGKTLAKCGKEARASQNHVHTTGSKSFADIRAEFEEKNKRKPTELEVFKQTHKRRDGSYVKNTATEEFMLDTDTYIQNELATNPTKPKEQIQNEAFSKLMYGEDVPKRPLGYGFGVKGSNIYGVHGILKKETVKLADNSTLAMQNMEKVQKMEKVVVNLTNDNKELQTKLNQTNFIMSKMLESIASGAPSSELAHLAKSILKSQISDATNDTFGDTDATNDTFGDASG